MKVLLINGSPRQGNTLRALQEIETVLHGEGIDTLLVSIGYTPQPDCIGCGACAGGKACAFLGDTYQLVRDALPECDGIIVGSPVYYAGPTGAVCSLLDRVFRSCKQWLEYKPAASIVVCRRGGASAAFDRLNKYFQITNMPLIGSQYWNMAYGAAIGEVEQDGEGMQTMRTLARNMAAYLKSNAATIRPQTEAPVKTNFIR